MRKSIFTKQYDAFVSVLTHARRKAGVTQADLARRLRMTQSAVSKCERGERRIDVIELRQWCAAIGRPLPDFISELERVLGD